MIIICRYGLCTPVSEMRPCIPGETAEKLHVDMDRKTNIQVCMKLYCRLIKVAKSSHI